MEGKKVIIVYFSRPDFNYRIEERQKIGNTKIVAGLLKELLNCDEFEIFPKTSYPIEYNPCCQRAIKEKDENARPEMANTTFPDFSKYDAVFLGFPIWCGTYPMIINTFFDKFPQDTWKDKLIAPFCTHEGSRFGRSTTDLEARIKGGKMDSGIPIQGHLAQNSKKQLEAWVKKLGFNVVA